MFNQFSHLFHYRDQYWKPRCRTNRKLDISTLWWNIDSTLQLVEKMLRLCIQVKRPTWDKVEPVFFFFHCLVIENGWYSVGDEKSCKDGFARYSMALKRPQIMSATKELSELTIILYQNYHKILANLAQHGFSWLAMLATTVVVESVWLLSFVAELLWVKLVVLRPRDSR